MAQLQFQHPQVPSGSIQESLRNILDVVPLCSIATVNEGGDAHINTAFFAVDWETFHLYFLSDPTTLHGANLVRSAHCALAVSDTRQRWGESLAGMQLFGSATLAATHIAAAATALYRQRHPAYGDWLDALDVNQKSALSIRFYAFVPNRVKVLDEDRFGEETFVECTIDRS
jgi:uncharacterized protein YhbP (UPF0306 family)